MNSLRPLRPSDGSSDNAPIKSGPTAGFTAPANLLRKHAVCSQCRIRKVRCDGRPGMCQNCDRLGFECSFQQSPSLSPGQYKVKLPERRRRMQACIPCHAKKTRCLGELPTCSNCLRKNRQCTYPKAKKHDPISDGRSSAEAAQASEKSSQQSVAFPGQDIGMMEEVVLDSDPEMAMGLMEDYFCYLYPLPSFAFLHKPTVLQRCRDKTMDETLKLAICAITSLQLQRSTLCHDLWAQKAEQSILQHLGRPSIFRLQALLLIVRYRIESGEFRTAFMLAALAARTALALRLNYERPELSVVAQEARRRLFWALYLLDDFFCVGLREFELCPEETIHLHLPCNDDYFDVDRNSHTLSVLLRPNPPENTFSIGLRGALIRVTSARRAIMRFNRRVGLGDELPSTIGESIRRFEEDLKALKATLGPLDQYSVTNLTCSKWPAQFVMLHFSWHQCHCDLYRLGIDGFSEAAPSPVLASIPPGDRNAMQWKCIEHAENIIRILSDFLNHNNGGCFLERDAAVCAFESARLIMFGSRIPGAASTLDVGIQKAKLSLRLMTEFYSYSASTQSLRKDLDRLIASYSVRLALQTQEGLPEPKPPSTRSSSKISQCANSRQRLSVQSLLLQSDFVDDSNDIVAPPQGGDSQANANGVHNSIHTARPREASSKTVSTATVSKDSDRTGQAHHNNGIVSPPGLTLDAGQEDAGLIFNPWMGFPSNEDVYGMSQFTTGLDEDY
ncbi:fungal-specific transcription factor domain-containing protein [Whalleya microplaca]|nr:fungal-specific transcription factor domain-containing protein [Whalleya microplaca]